MDNQQFTTRSVQEIQAWIIRRLRAVVSIKSHNPWPSSSFAPAFHSAKERPDPLEDLAIYMKCVPCSFLKGTYEHLVTIKYKKENAQIFWELIDTGSRLPL